MLPITRFIIRIARHPVVVEEVESIPAFHLLLRNPLHTPLRLHRGLRILVQEEVVGTCHHPMEEEEEEATHLHTVEGRIIQEVVGRITLDRTIQEVAATVEVAVGVIARRRPQGAVIKSHQVAEAASAAFSTA